ncbi:hypothetical protein [Paenibacillus sp. AR247]|uniref:hypothetical protein n=1 Tax=Paenibacillus sp. AR247 TaxID=1631599 RepID=UPI0015E37BAA|nr:hypothetical protein [Paenibacillus sp. AR247]
MHKSWFFTAVILIPLIVFFGFGGAAAGLRAGPGYPVPERAARQQPFFGLYIAS